jgi:hypothetical protein
MEMLFSSIIPAIPYMTHYWLNKLEGYVLKNEISMRSWKTIFWRGKVALPTYSSTNLTKTKINLSEGSYTGRKVAQSFQKYPTNNSAHIILNVFW